MIFYEFFKTGLFAVGGGLATLPFLREMGLRTGWFDETMLADMVAVSESTPGPMGINMASYVGFTLCGPPGALVATLGEVTPSVIIILIVASFLRAFRDNRYVGQVFYGMRPASTGLIAAAGIGVLRLCMLDAEALAAGTGLLSAFNWKGLVLFAVLWLLTNLVPQTKKLHPLWFIGLSAILGIVFHFS